MKSFFKYLKNIFLGLLIGAVFGAFLGLQFGRKSGKRSDYENRKNFQVVVFSILGSIGGVAFGYIMSKEDNQ